MIEWSEGHASIRDAFRKFCELEVKPKLHAIEHEGEPPYEVLRKMVATFGIADMAKARFDKQIARQKEQSEAKEPRPPRTGPNPQAGMEMAMRMPRLSSSVATASGW